MKKLILCGCLSTLLLFTSCFSCHFSSNKLEASKTIVEKEMKLEPFDKVDIDLVGHVKIVQSQPGDYRVVLSAPENYVDYFKFEVDDHELEATEEGENLNLEDAKIRITIYTPTLCELENDGICSVMMDSLKTKLLKVENSGVGTIKMRRLDIEKTLVDCSGVGGITLSGVTTWLNLDCSGVGSIDASEMKARRVKGEVSGVGGIDCYATDTLKAVVSGVGSLKYGGNPAVKKLDASGIGKISER